MNGVGKNEKSNKRKHVLLLGFWNLETCCVERDWGGFNCLKFPNVKDNFTLHKSCSILSWSSKLSHFGVMTKIPYFFSPVYIYLLLKVRVIHTEARCVLILILVDPGQDRKGRSYLCVYVCGSTNLTTYSVSVLNKKKKKCFLWSPSNRENLKQNNFAIPWRNST